MKTTIEKVFFTLYFTGVVLAVVMSVIANIH